MASNQKTSDQANKTSDSSPNDDQERDQLLARLEAAEQRALEAEQALRDKETAGSSLRVRPEDAPFAGPLGGYEFEVGPRHRAKFKHLPVLKVNAVDESEAIRWYCVTHQHPEDSGKRVDPVMVKIDARCLDSRRSKAIRLQQRLAGLRSKIEAGAALTEEDQKLLSDYEAEVLRYPGED